MSKDMKNIVRALCFMVLLGFVLYTLQSLVTPKIDWPDYNRRTTKTVRGFFSEKDNTLDYLCVGSSFMFSGLSPMEIYRDTHMRGYVLAGVGQRAALGYQLLKTAMKEQRPKVVIAEMSSLFKSVKKNKSIPTWQSTINALPLTRVADRVDMARALASIRGDRFDKVYLERSVLPLVLYHSRYRMSQSNYLNLHTDQVYHRKGYVAQSRIKAAKHRKKKPEKEDVAEDAAMAEAVNFNRVYYEKIQALCKANGCELLMVKIPMNTSPTYSSAWTRKKHDAVQALADEMGVTFIDLNDIDIGIDWKTDTSDGGRHLNLSGATRVSDYLGKWMLENCGVQPKADEKLDAEWDAQLRLYDWEMEIFRLQMEFDPVEFLKRAAEGNNTLMVASSGGVGEYWTEEMQAAFESATGSQIDLRAIDKAAYACVSDRGELVAEETDGGKCSIDGVAEGGRRYALTSSAGSGKKQGKIQVDGAEMSSTGKGLHFVVYNNDLKCVVDSVSFNTFEEDCPGTRDNEDYTGTFRIQLIDYAYAYLRQM